MYTFIKNSSTGEIFYVGIGNTKRPYNKSGRNPTWKEYIKSNNYEVIVLHNNLSWKQAAIIEKDMIKEIGRKDHGAGTLLNKSNGGEGYPHSTEWSIADLEKEALQYYQIKAFRKQSAEAYNVAKKIGIIDVICSHMIDKRIWLEEEIYQEALKYSNKSDFEKISPYAYKAAVKFGIIDAVCEHMIGMYRSIKNLPEHMLPIAMETLANHRRILREENKTTKRHRWKWEFNA